MANLWQGQLVRLRATEPEDWQAFYDWDLDSEVGRLVDFVWFPGSRERHKKRTAEQATAEIKNQEFCWVIESLGGEFVGAMDTHACDTRTGTFEYGVAIKPEHQRRGYASEAIRLVLRHYFRELRFQKVNVHVYDFNEASLELHRRLGFREEGRLRRMIYTNGRFYDDVILGMTSDEFEELHGAAL